MIESIVHLVKNNSMEKIKVEIWSDIMCPFCYIGKRHFEQAIQQLGYQEVIELEWKSFQLDPTIPRDQKITVSVYEYIAERKGWSIEQTKQIHQQVVDMAANVGLSYQFDMAKIANSYLAHLLIQLAKKEGFGDAIEELLFEGYFTKGLDLRDIPTLVNLGLQVGLSKESLQDFTTSKELDTAFKKDFQEAAQIGVTGVPFFVFDRKYAISGAQPVPAFIQTLEQLVTEKGINLNSISSVSSNTCNVDGTC